MSDNVVRIIERGPSGAGASDGDKGHLTITGNGAQYNIKTDAPPLVAKVTRYATRAALVAAVAGGLVEAAGMPVFAGVVFNQPLIYVWQPGATAIPDMPGLVPGGDIHAGHFGTLGTANDAPVMQLAINYAESVKGRALEMPVEKLFIRDTLVIDQGMTFICKGGAIPSAPLPNLANVSAALVWNTLTAAPMIRIRAATYGQRVQGVELKGIFLDGANVATHGVLAESPQKCFFDVTTYRTTLRGLEINDANGELANQNYIMRFEHFCGPNIAAWNCTALALDGDYTGKATTSTYAGWVEVEYVFGDGIMIRAHDSATFVRAKSYVRGGSGGTGWSVAFRKSVFGLPVPPPFHCQKNIFFHLYATGKIFNGDYCQANVIWNLSSEGGSIVYESDGPLKGALHVKHVADFRTGEAWGTPEFDLIARPIISGDTVARGTSPARGTLGGVAVNIGSAWSFAPNATQGLMWSDVFEDNIYIGKIVGIRMVIQSVGSVTGNSRWRVNFDITPIGAAVGGLGLNETFTVTPTQNAPSVITAHDLIFSTPQSVTALGSVWALSIERLGNVADALDTYPQSVILVSRQFLYEGSGPSTAGYGPYQPPVLFNPNIP